jgi:hypothetical protein
MVPWVLKDLDVARQAKRTNMSALRPGPKAQDFLLAFLFKLMLLE